jgi:hypothetical protein
MGEVHGGCRLSDYAFQVPTRRSQGSGQLIALQMILDRPVVSEHSNESDWSRPHKKLLVKFTPPMTSLDFQSRSQIGLVWAIKACQLKNLTSETMKGLLVITLVSNSQSVLANH